jgi:hypothetical protein
MNGESVVSCYIWYLWSNLLNILRQFIAYI